MSIEGDVFALMKVLEAGSEVHRDNRRAKSLMERKIREKLTGARSGHLYTTLFFTRRDGAVVPYGERPPHLASAPGEPPAYDTGTLLRGMKVTARRDASGAVLTFASTAGYGTYLEFGTSRMRPRPFMRPLGRENAPELRRIYANGIEGRERLKARALGGKG